MPLTTNDLCLVAGKISMLKKPPSLRWAQKLVRKEDHGTSLKNANMIHRGRAAAATEEQFDEHFSVLKKLIDDHEFKPECIFNMNETGWSKEQQKQKVTCRRGKKCKRPNKKKAFTGEHITSVHTISADGVQLNTMIIYKESEPKFAEGELPDGFIIRHAVKGFINTELFIDWLKTILIFHISSRRLSICGPYLLTMDNASPHISLEAVLLCIQYGIHIFCLLPNASGWLQPLDQIFDPLKEQAFSISQSLSLSIAGYITNKKKFPYILALSQKAAFTRSVVASSFVNTGIHPFNPDAADRTCVVKSSKNTNSKQTPASDFVEPILCPECERSSPCHIV